MHWNNYARQYYELNPPKGNYPGDIWCELPSGGLLGEERTSGIVITPACDLSNRKVDTITYLPIIPVLSYFSTTAFLPEVRRRVDGQLSTAGLAGLVKWSESLLPPEASALASAQRKLEECLESKSLGAKQLEAGRRALVGVRIIMEIAAPTLSRCNPEDLHNLFREKEWEQMRTQIVTNSYRNDIHFLPGDGQDKAWSGVPEHSLVLFRYPMTMPTELFESAQDVGLSDWNSAVEVAARTMPVARAFSGVRPTKRIRLLPRFFADLMTRYVSIYIRIGSPDFSQGTVQRYAEDIGRTA